MRRRIFFSVTLCALVAALAVGAVAARAAGPTGKPTVKVIVVLKGKADAAEVVARLARDHATGVYRYRYFSAIAATVSPSQARALAGDGNVAAVVADHKVRAPKVPSLEVSSTTHAGASGVPGVLGAASGPLEPEALQLTHAQDAWAIKVKGRPVMGQGIRVGMLDTGVDMNQPDLAGAVVAYRDFTGAGLSDDIGHGTATAGCIAAQGIPLANAETATSMRVEGMAPRAKIVMAKVLDLGGGWDSNVMRGIEWLIDQKVDIISCSLGDTYIPPNGADPAALEMQKAIDHGITVVNAEGNEGPGQGTDGSAPDLKNLIAVGATTGFRLLAQIDALTSGSAYRGDQVITWSGRGPNSRGDFRPDIMGFGAYGWALIPSGQGADGSDLQTFGGTSMAAPVVAGDLALAESAWKMKHPGRRLPAPSYWKNLLATTATDLGYPALDQSSGLVNAAAAVREVLRQGRSFLASVAADPKNPSSWSVRAAGGARAATTISVRNTGATRERVTLRATTYATLKTLSYTPITLDPQTAYSRTISFSVPAGTDLVQARVTWPSGPLVSLESAVYDSKGKLVSYGETAGGYGHLSYDQVALRGPVTQRPTVRKGASWHILIEPSLDLAPTAPQTAHLQITFLRRVRSMRFSLSRGAVSIAPGKTVRIRTHVTAPHAAGTSFYGIEVGNGSTTTTIPVAVRVPIRLTASQGTLAGTFSGTITGSTAQYSGGEFYFYDVHVPAGTHSITASLHWPDTGNLVDLYLIDPKGDLRDAKGGDLVWYPDYSSGQVPDPAFSHTAEQVIWDAPEAGTWQVLVWAAGFDGNSFAEPYGGKVTLDAPTVAPASWTGTAPAGGQVSADFTVTNAGDVALPASAESQATTGGQPVSDDVTLDPPFSGALTPTTDGISPIYSFTLPQYVDQVTATATWTGPDQLVDLGLYDPSQTDKAESLAPSSAGNTVQVVRPLAGPWTLILGYGVGSGSVVPAPAEADYTVTVDYTAPRPIAGLTSSATAAAPLVVAAHDSGVIHVTIDVPADAQPGDTITGLLHFSTAGDGTQIDGGDHLGTVPVTITVGSGA